MRNMRGDNFPSGVESLLSQSLKALNLDVRIKEYTCVQLWDEIVGEQVAGAAQPEFIRDGKMFVITKSPVWANELNLYKPDIISRLNRRVGSAVVKDIIFKAGRLPKKKRISDEETSKKPNIEGIQLTDEELKKVEETVKAAGEDMSEDLEKLLTTSIRLDKWKRAQGWIPCKRCGTLQHASTGVCPPCQNES